MALNSPAFNLALSRGPNLPGIPDIEVDLTDPDWTIFKAVQHIIQSSNIGSKSDKIRRVWEPTYVIVYREQPETKSGSVSAVGGEECAEGGSSSSGAGGRRMSAGSGANSCSLPQLPILTQSHCSMDEVRKIPFVVH